MRAVIISNGSITDYNCIRSMINCDDFVIAADGALFHCSKLGILPDVWIGDNDSCMLDKSEIEDISKKCRVIRLNPEKDATDTEAACDYAIAEGFDSVLMLGSCGSRFDHTLANVYLLRKLADSGIYATIANEHNIIFLAKHHNVIQRSEYSNVSVIPIEGDVTSISNKGFYYTLDNEILAMYSSRGVSNYLVEDVGEITIDSGTALIVLSRD